MIPHLIRMMFIIIIIHYLLILITIFIIISLIHGINIVAMKIFFGKYLSIFFILKYLCLFFDNID